MEHRQAVIDAIRDIPDFPKPGVLFKDITPIMEDPAAYRASLEGLKGLIKDQEFTKLAAIESRGFLFGGPMGLELNKPMCLLRKAGKLPGDTRAVTYALEYGEATLEAHVDSFGPGDRVLIVDDLLATGGSALAAAELVRLGGAEVSGFLFLVELDFLHGRAKLEAEAPVFSLVTY